MSRGESRGYIFNTIVERVELEAVHVRDLAHGQVLQLRRDASPAGASGLIRNVVGGRLRVTDDPEQQAADAALLQEGLDPPQDIFDIPLPPVS
jgi:hypothetical protein